MSEYFYDNQVKRFLLQFAKIFSNHHVTRGVDPNGNPIIARVPIQYGDSSRQAATIVANNSANNMPSAPIISYYITGLEYDQKRTQEPFYVEKQHIRQRAFNDQTGLFEESQGQAFTIEKLMPVPYTLRLTVDFWTSNYQQKLELIEQIAPLFNPSLEIQSTDNYLDWTSLSIVYQDGISFSSRTIPVGSGNAIDILSWKFYIPIWLSTSAKLKKLGMIQKVVASVYNGKIYDDIQNDDLLLGTRQKISPFGYKLLLKGNKLQLLPDNSATDNETIDIAINPDTADISWSGLLNSYGVIKPGISQIWLQHERIDNDVVGTFIIDPNDDRYLIIDVDIDTLPSNTLLPIDLVIDPLQKAPNIGLRGATLGDRYLITNKVGSTTSISEVWGTLIADKNDIVEYNGTDWFVAFDSSEAMNDQTLINLTSNVQFRYEADLKKWTKSYEGFYQAGNYSIVI